MLYYDRIDRSKGIDHAKSNNSKECTISHYWFFNHGFKFQDSVCNSCHDFTMLCLNISDIAIITVINVVYHCIIHDISKSDTINLLENSVCLKIMAIYKNGICKKSILKIESTTIILTI